jgi:hypothetical protein
MGEIWKTLKYHDTIYNNYEVSTFGNIRHKLNKNNRSLWLGADGYYRIAIHICYINGKKKLKTIKLHIAVASTFIDNPERKCTVNHIDGNKHNNCVDNLEWATQYEQAQHATNILGYRQVYSDTMRNTFSKKIAQYNKNNELVKIWNSTREVEYTLGFRHENVSACARGNRKTAYGYIWKYVV